MKGFLFLSMQMFTMAQEGPCTRVISDAQLVELLPGDMVQWGIEYGALVHT